MLRGPREVVVERPSLLRFKISHDGYLPRFGVTPRAPESRSRRRETCWRGEDRLEGHYTGPADAQVAIRFHLHPSIRASVTRGGRIAMLVLPDGETWQGVAPGFLFELEESIFLAATDGAKRTQQLVLSCPAQMKKAAQWRFERPDRSALTLQTRPSEHKPVPSRAHSC